MGQFSIEPPRKQCRAHYTFEHIAGDRVVDMSPQKNDGDVEGTVNRAPGFIGNGFDFDGSTYVDVPSGLLEADEDFTVAFYVDVGDSTNEQRLISLRGDVTFSTRVTASGDLEVYTGTWHTIETGASGPRHVSIDHNSDTDETIVRVDSEIELVYAEEVTADSETNIIGRSASTNGQYSRSVLDEIRVYREELTEQQQVFLYEMGARHQRVDDLGNAWDNKGLPFIKGKGNANLAGTLGEKQDAALRQLDYIIEARHVEDAAGQQLDRIGQVAGIRRQEGEEDPRYRARIIGTLAAGRSDGTFQGILEATASILDTDVGRVFLEEAWQNDPTAGVATARVYVRNEDLEDSALTASDLTDILKNVVAGGHDIEVLERGANAFTLRDDTQPNDPSLGLTSDSIATGGGLVSDV